MYSNWLTRFFLSEFKKQTLVTKAKSKFLLYYILFLIPQLGILIVISYHKQENLLLLQNVLFVTLFIIALVYLKHGKLDVVVNICLVLIGFVLQSVLLLRNIVEPQFVTIKSFGFDLIFLVSIIIVIVASLVSIKFYQVLIINSYTLLLVTVNLMLHFGKDISYHVAIIAITFLCSVFSFVIFFIIRRLDFVLRQRKSLNQLLKYKLIQEQKLKFDAESANRAKSEFLSNISHEFLTPMNAVVGFTDILLSENQNAAQIENLKQIKVAANKLLGLIDEIIDFSKIEKGDFSIKMHDFSIKNEVYLISDQFLKAVKVKGLALDIQIADNVPDTIIADHKRVNQVITFLVDNAIKFTEKGFVTIDCCLKSIDYKGYLEISVSDTGVGISQQKLNRLFHSFTQLDGSLSRGFGGLGLGLVKARTLVNLMGGDLIAESEEGKGSVFTFIIPLKVKNLFDEC